MNKFFLRLFCMSLPMVALLSCESDDDSDSLINQSTSGKVLIQTTIKNTDGASGSSYIQLIPDFSKRTVDNSNSIQVGFSSGLRVYENDVFVFPEFGKDGTQELTKYAYNASTGLSKSATLSLPPLSGAFNMVKYNDEKAYVSCYNLGKMLIINPKTMTQIGEIDLTSYAHGDNNPDPSYPIIRDGLLYVPLDQVSSSWMPYPDYKQSDVVIIDVTTDKVMKVISEKKSGMTFPTRPAYKDMIFTDENNDLYVACVGGFGLDTRFPETGFVCIPSGKTEFDETASWDVSQTTIEGTNYKAASVYNCKYLGNGKLCAYVVVAELMGDNAYTSKYCMAVLMDVKNKTITKINGIPVTDGHSVYIDTYNDLVVFASYGETQAGFFTYNPADGTVSDGPVVATSGNPIFMHSFE